MSGGAILIAIYAMHIVLMFALPLASVWKYYDRLPSFARTKQRRAPGEQVLMTNGDLFMESHGAYAVAVHLTFALRVGTEVLIASPKFPFISAGRRHAGSLHPQATSDGVEDIRAALYLRRHRLPYINGNALYLAKRRNQATSFLIGDAHNCATDLRTH